MLSQSKLLTPAQTAGRLAISTRHLRDLTDDGEIAYVDIGRKSRPNRRYSEQDVANFIDTRRRLNQPAMELTAATIAPSTSIYEVIDFKTLRETLRQRRKASKESKRNPDPR